MRSIATVLTALVIAGTVSACGGTQPDGAPAPAAEETLRAVSTTDGSLTVRREPSAEGAVLTRLSESTALGSPRVLLVEERRDGWVKVALPVRPNGSTGWVAEDDVLLEPVRGSVRIDLAKRRLVYTLDGRQVTSAEVAIGTTRNPTPTGDFFVTDRIRPADPDGAYGAFALGISAHSETLTEFAGGDGQIGIHGTNAVASIGRAVSHGCVRVTNDVAALLAGIPLGTPVAIR